MESRNKNKSEQLSGGEEFIHLKRLAVEERSWYIYVDENTEKINSFDASYGTVFTYK